MKYLVLALLILTGCGKNAELISAPSVFAPKSGNFNLLTNQDVNEEVRDASILVYPNDSDFEGYSNTLPKNIYDALFTGGFKKINRSIPKNASNYEKKRRFVQQIMGIGAARDRYFVEMLKNDVEIEKLAADLKSDIFEKYPCYQFKDGENKNKCTLTKSDATKPKAKVQKNCKRFRSYLKRFVVISDADKAAYESAITKCFEDNEVLQGYKDANKQLDLDRTAGRDAAFQLLETVQDRSGLKYYASVTASESKVVLKRITDVTDEGVEITLGYEVEEIELKMFNGNDTSVYSTSGGEIVVQSFEQRKDGNKILKIKIDLQEFVIETDLWFATHANFDLRLVSKDLFATYPDGSKREGVMKIELDFVE
jgi:hypothetical protein